jgi:hypothetical protein
LKRIEELENQKSPSNTAIPTSSVINNALMPAHNIPSAWQSLDDHSDRLQHPLLSPPIRSPTSGQIHEVFPCIPDWSAGRLLEDVSKSNEDDFLMPINSSDLPTSDRSVLGFGPVYAQFVDDFQGHDMLCPASPKTVSMYVKLGLEAEC